MANETLRFSACEVGSDMIESVPEVFSGAVSDVKLEHYVGTQL
jgi:hypothetical protein